MQQAAIWRYLADGRTVFAVIETIYNEHIPLKQLNRGGAANVNTPPEIRTRLHELRVERDRYKPLPEDSLTLTRREQVLAALHEGGLHLDDLQAETVAKHQMKSSALEAYARWATANKVVSTYGDSLRAKVNPKTGRIHSSYNQVVSTGRTSCIAAGTPIDIVRDLSKNRKGVPIEDVKEGDLAYTFDDRALLMVRRVLRAGKTGHKPVVRLHWRGGNYRHRGHLDLTSDHPVRLVDGSYRPAGELKPGDDLLSLNGEKGSGYAYLCATVHEVLSIEPLPGMVDVYDITIEDTQNFIAAEICVHNSSDPNMQNMPRDIRACFKPAPGNKLVVADFANMELRIAAGLSGDPVMIDAFSGGKDLHAMTAAAAWPNKYRSWRDVPRDSDDRAHSKTSNFATIYGTSPQGLVSRGDFGLSIILNHPDASFLNVLAMSFGSVVDRNWILQCGSSCDAERPMGTGPFMFGSRVRGQQLVLVRNPRYFRPTAGNIDTVVIMIGPTPELALLRLQRGQVDLLGDGIPPGDFGQIIASPVYRRDIVTEPLLADGYVAMNERVKPFDNVLVRRAINMAVDKKFILRLVNNRGVVARGILPPGLPGYGPIKGYPYNPVQAKALLVKVGYPHGFSATLYSDNVDPDPRIIVALQQMLARIGVVVALRSIDYNTLTAFQSDPHKIAMVWTGWYMDFPDPSDFYGPILSCDSAVPGSLNFSWTCNHTLDAFALELKRMVDQKERLAQYRRLDQMVMDYAPWVPIYHPIGYTLHGPALHNFYYHDVWQFVYQDYSK